jgi:creatinine amidohydrolase
LTWPALEEYSKGNDPLILPIGSVEGHGAHLPISTDFLLASHVSDVLAERNGWISLPPVTYTIAVPARIGNVDISQESFRDYLREILEHFIGFGQKKFILILGHGGPDMKNSIEKACKRLCRNEDVSILAFHTLRVLEDLKLVDQSEDRHAGGWETSLMLKAHSDLVGDVGVYKDSDDLGRYATFGDPRKSNTDMGENYMKAVLERIEEVILESKLGGFVGNWQ